MKISGMKRGNAAVAKDNRRVDRIQASPSDYERDTFWWSVNTIPAKPDNYYVTKLAEHIIAEGGVTQVSTRGLRSLLWRLGYRFLYYKGYRESWKPIVRRAYKKAQKKQAGVA